MRSGDNAGRGPGADAEAGRDAVDQDSVDLEGVVRSLGDHARKVNLARAARLADAVDQAEVTQLPDGQRRAAAEVAHQVVGSAGTFGFPRASRLAAELERFFAVGELDRTRLGWARAQVDALIDQLRSDPDL